ncbi:helix-turn-helix domain-containing protein [Paenibacillus sp. WQ 127069]|uniref:Helix-turn-helix domain-containing protein n=1 Tax=Paenibacillus baimaensis TaxID=2982185 RepID=A0ABT2UDP8_9BACL|nr:helix-turn-helix domain-containing protein [Paenibacillus sp. WQ 127069]MCU6792727.1 helix-turn-helix domain-containing protein [Paenibacillus sp. WQ 127069]
MRNKSYFLKLLSFNIIMVIISVSFLGYIAYLKTTNLINEKINKINSQLLVQTQLQVENSLQSIESAIVQFSLSPSFTSILEDDLKIISYDNYVKVRNIIQDISSLYSHGSIISSIEIINLEKGWVLRNGGLLPLQEVYGSEEIRQIQQTPSSSSWNNVNSDYFQYTLKVPFSSFNKFQGVIRARISSSGINKELVASKDLGEMTLIEANGNVIRNLSQYNLNKEDINNVIRLVQSKEKENPRGDFLTNIKGVEYSLIFLQSAKYNWTYLSMVSTLEAKRNSGFIGLFIFITSFVVIGVFFVFSFLGTRKLYSPIKRLYQLVALNSNDKSNLHVQSNEMDFINTSIQNFFQDSNKLKGQLDIQTNQLNDFFAFKLFQGEVKQHEVESKFGNLVSWDQYCVLTVQIDTLDGTAYRQADRDLLLFAVKNMLGEIASQLLVLYPVIINNIQVVLVGVTHKNLDVFKEDVYLLSRSIQQTVKQYLKLQVSIGISNPFSKSVHASIAYHEAVDALKSRITHGREAILYMSDFEEDEAAASKYPAFIVKEVIDSIKFNDIDQSKRALHSFVAEIYSGHYGYKYCSMFVFLLLIDLIKISHHSDEMFLKLFKEKPLFDQLDQLLQQSAHEMELWIYDNVIEPIIEEMLARSETQQRNITKALVQFIHDEYDLDLTLEACASRLHYNPNYLGQIFKKETGSTFSDYLSQYRLNISKKWLSETNAQVQEIAEKLRFSNSQNFIRYFKKMEGITPKQYRDKF